MHYLASILLINYISFPNFINEVLVKNNIYTFIRRIIRLQHLNSKTYIQIDIEIQHTTIL